MSKSTPRVTTRDHAWPRVTTSHHESPRMTTSEKAKKNQSLTKIKIWLARKNIKVNFMGNAKGKRTMGLTDIPQRKLLCGTDDYRLKWIKLIPWHLIYGECIICLFVSHVTGEDGVLERQVIVKGKPNLVLLVYEWIYNHWEFSEIMHLSAAITWGWPKRTPGHLHQDICKFHLSRANIFPQKASTVPHPENIILKEFQIVR